MQTHTGPQPDDMEKKLVAKGDAESQTKPTHIERNENETSALPTGSVDTSGAVSPPVRHRGKGFIDVTPILLGFFLIVSISVIALVLRKKIKASVGN